MSIDTALPPVLPTTPLGGTDSFAALGVPKDLTAVLTRQQITIPTPIQAATLPDSLAGRDVLGRGRTGSGKTYAFLLPLVARLTATPNRSRSRRPRAVILAPTRELVTQIDAALAPLASAAGLSSRTVFGGVGQHPQVSALARGVDILVACPGRLEDLMRQGHAILDQVEITVLDEADHMADLGFLPAVRRILSSTPGSGQRLLFSATLDRAVDTLVKQFLHNPVVHEADSPQSPVSAMSHHVLHVSAAEHLPVLTDLAAAPGRTVVFVRTKSRARKFAKQLNAAGVPTVELHGNLAQNARQRNLDAFSSGAAETLVATDIAARGIHVDDVSLVVHADPPVEHKAYLHRSGRTARAGNAGTVVTLMTDAQVHDVRDLSRKAGIRPTTTVARAGHPILTELAPGERSFPGGRVVTPSADAERSGGRGRRPQSGGGGRSRRPQGSGGGRRPEGNSGSGRGTKAADGGRRAESSTRRPASGGGGRRTSAGSGARSAADFSTSAGRSRRRGR